MRQKHKNDPRYRSDHEKRDHRHDVDQRDDRNYAMSESHTDVNSTFQLKITWSGNSRIITLNGSRADYSFEYDENELEIEKRNEDFEWEFEGVDSFEFLSPSSNDDTPSPSIATLSGPLHYFDFILQGNELVARNRFDGEMETLAGYDSVIAGAETYDVSYIAAQVIQPGPDLLAEGGPRLMMVNTPEATPSVLWDQILQAVIIENGGGPTNAARAFSILHTAIYDAQASYSPVAKRVSIDIESDNFDPAVLGNAADKEITTAMHVAAHYVLSELYPQHQSKFDQVLSERLDLDVSDEARAYKVGIDAAQDGLTLRLSEAATLSALSEELYTPVNPDPTPETRQDISRWSPEKQGLLSPTPDALQNFLTPEISLAEGFALPETLTGDTDTSLTRPDGPEPFFTPEHAGTILDFQAKTVTLAAPTEIEGVMFEAGTTVPVTKALIGPVINTAFIAQAEAVVQTSANLTEEEKLIAEFWEDGPGTSFPPGAWMTLAQYVSQRDSHDAATDALLFMSMGNAMFDAAIATWDAKVHFDYARPVTVIRDLGYLDLIGEPGRDEITGETGHVIQAYGGIDPDTGVSRGTQTILAENFITYQLPGSEQSPPFAEYTSGHSTFSSAGAAVLREFTGSDEFNAGLAVSAGTSAFDTALPSGDYQFHWNTFSEAAIEGGISRIYGAIHFSDGNIDGLSMGEGIGINAYALAEEFVNGTAKPEQQPFFDEFVIV